MKPDPIHPDDVEQLLKIRRYLIGYRKTNKWTQGDLSKMISGTEGEGWVYDLETNPDWNWRMSRLQAWPEPFGLRLEARVMFPAHTLTRRVNGHPEVAPFYELACKGTGLYKQWQRAYLTAALRIARLDQGISGASMGKMLGCTRGAVNSWEREADDVMIPKVMHYARTLGGHVRVGLESLHG